MKTIVDKYERPTAQIITIELEGIILSASADKPAGGVAAPEYNIWDPSL